MSKRKSPSDPTLEPKKLKATTSITSFQTLSPDEICCIADFLPLGSILMFALTSKSHHEMINRHVHDVAPYHVTEGRLRYSYVNSSRNVLEWSIARAGKTKRFLSVDTENYEQVMGVVKQLVEKKEDFGKLTSCLLLNEISVEQAVNLLSAPTALTVNVKMWNKNNQDGNDHNEEDNDNHEEDGKKSTRITIPTTIEHAPIGFGLQHLQLILDFGMKELCTILSNCLQLQSLSVWSQEPNSNGSTLEDNISIPLMEKLRVLDLRSYFDYDSNDFVYYLLALCPNLETFKFVYYYPQRIPFCMN